MTPEISVGFGGSGLQTLNSTKFGATDEWVFFATSWDEAAEEIKFYAGWKTESVSLLHTVTGITSSQLGNITTLVVNGRATGQTVSFQGLMDNVAIWTGTDASGVQSLSTLEEFRATTIPEVSQSSLALGITALMALLMRRKVR